MFTEDIAKINRIKACENKGIDGIFILRVKNNEYIQNELTLPSIRC
ncbi:hypothetical protein RV12_GL002083 [Enterococcus quebecensis]|nr:hypothetical protein RV12_GL002083 [Enterococcus quebecensis]